ncbi:MAG: hypothetical protein E7301_00540 [Butyrivibrio sp.]|uniref:rod-binding protein n=1 Tax=Butyrivibrio sp. NC2002 TaxID=1410610 RepID=UPI0005685BC6|nr:rod-binding protein [Butyrivibrio sp. NC2002]MBE5858603.1 hypothetical protein [Butyrivibrio sp.]
MALDLNSLNVSGISQFATSKAIDNASKMVSDAKTKVDTAAKNGDKEEINEELMSACKQFEAYMLEQIFKGYEETNKVFSKDDDKGSMGTLVNYFKDFAIQDISSTASDKQSTGLAQMLYENMKRTYDL